MKDASNNVMSNLYSIVSAIVNSPMQESTKTQCVSAVFQNVSIVVNSDDAEYAQKETHKPQ